MKFEGVIEKFKKKIQTMNILIKSDYNFNYSFEDEGWRNHKKSPREMSISDIYIMRVITVDFVCITLTIK